MNKSESKYFATAVRMDEAFLRLLEKKDFAYITVKEGPVDKLLIFAISHL